MKYSHLIGIVVCAACAPVVFAADSEIADKTTNTTSAENDFLRNENQELIVAVKYRNKQFLSDGMIAYAVEGDIALPLEQFLFLVEFPIRVRPDLSGADGWFIRESRRFRLDLNTQTAVSDGKNYKFDKGQVKVIEGDIYVPTKILSEWFPLNVDGDLRSLGVVIIPKESTAIDEKLERQNRQFGKVYQVTARNSEHHTPYNLITPPSLSANFSVGYHSADDDDDNDLLGSYTIRAHGDLAYMGSEITLIGNQEELSNARLKLSRRNPRGGLFGNSWLSNATDFEVGDISGTALPLIQSSSVGRGIRIASSPAGYKNGFEKVTIEGIKGPGDDVELYRNNILVNAVQSGTATRYEFKDLDLYTGLNEFRVEFYGPQGQRSTRVERYYSGASRLKPGELNYDISVSQPGRTVFDVGVNSNENYLRDGITGQARIDYGVNRALSVRAGASSLPIKEDQDRIFYGLFGATVNHSGWLGSVDLAYDDEGESAWSFQASRKISQADFFINYKRYSDGFISNRETSDSSNNGLKTTATVGVNSQRIKVSDHTLFSVGVKAAESKYYDDKWLRELDLDLTAQYKRAQLATSLDYSDSSVYDESTLIGRTSLSLSGFNSDGLRLIADYEIEPEKELTRAQIAYTRRLKASNVRLNVGYDENYTNESRSLNIGVTKPFKFATVGLSATKTSYDNGEDDSALFLTVDFATFTDKKSLRTSFYNEARPLTATKIDAFYDYDKNGLFDGADVAAADINFRGFNRTTGKTGDNGQALLIGAAYSDWIDINVVGDSLPEPNTVAAKNGWAVLGRPGVTTELKMPIVPTAEVEGNITLLRGGETVPLPNVVVQAVQRNPTNGQMRVVKEVQSSFDGFYSMAGIPTGATEIRLDPDQIKRLAVKGYKPITLNTNRDRNFFSDQNFNLTR